ncbi:2-keto-3-deoxy-L-rhamnonate aldolase [Maridesulfovibrio zosterae]|uniref:2-keto-3-deoxy-L-rhamnonate aldolase n=1 Tax=Maridesulfovibrio zosterae TaxID=82171 RepID=UPI0003FE4C41|nr:2-keto-3-deoxy-L-rhamnonate aldolase [Maridesulfovibrio zosterae]
MIIKNKFKEAITKGEVQIGLWLSTASSYMAEMAATSDYDWLLIDGEHAPNNVQSLLGQLQAVAPYPAHPVVRPLKGDTALLKQVLDIGAQTVLVPMVDTAEDARNMVAALRYPPKGKRGVGASIARASRWMRVPDYMAHAEENLCLLVQAESCEALENLDEILDVDGVDGVFIGPADLSASMGHPDDAGHPEVQAAIEHCIRRIREKGKAAGTLAVDPDMAHKCIEWGATFVAVAVDTMAYIDAIDAALVPFKGAGIGSEKKKSY